jgi:hypothetical protein
LSVKGGKKFQFLDWGLASPKNGLTRKEKVHFQNLQAHKSLKWAAVSRSELAATSAPVQDEAIPAILGMNPNTSKQGIFIFLFPCPGFFLPLFSAPKFSPPTYLTSFCAHLHHQSSGELE